MKHFRARVRTLGALTAALALAATLAVRYAG
jgi:hypothetical protein